MKWLKNLESIAKTGNPGECPHCKSSNMTYAQIIDDEKTSMGHGVVWCEDCRKAFHISRIKVQDKDLKTIPKDLVFD